jgi:C4-dicarboxylate transporter DctM subunit
VTPLELGVLGFAALLTLIALRVPIAVAMMTVGLVGYSVLNGMAPLLAYLKTAAFWTYHVYDLAVVPLFLLMSQFATRADLSTSLFRAANAFLGHRRGGIAMAAIGGCAGFGAICGSSVATAVTMAKVALPELQRYRYAGDLATGTLAAGGTLGILIPPSIVLVIYAIITEANIATLFQAALVPGILAAVGYMLAIAVYVRIRPEAGPAGPRTDASQRLRSLVDIWPVVAIFAAVMGGIYFGVFSPTEGAAVGAVGTGVVALARGALGWRQLKDCLIETAGPTGAIFMVLLGSEFFSAFLGLTRLPNELAELFGGPSASPYLVLAAILLLYLVLGCVMDSLSMILLTMPVLWPVVAALNFGMPPDDVKIWFGIIVLITVEMGLITPPVGLNVFIINSMAKNVPMAQTFRGVSVFLASDILRVLVLIAAPVLILGLPRLFN